METSFMFDSSIYEKQLLFYFQKRKHTQKILLIININVGNFLIS